MSADPTAREQVGRPFQPGQSGNPLGRPKGSRNKLGEDFIQALYADWQEHGKDAIERVRETRPQDYLKLIASILPRRVELRGNPFSDIGDEELAALITALQAALAAAVEDDPATITTPETAH
jgi:Family of unknown function (DUF5681)